MTLYLLALFLGVIAGLRAMTAPAAVSWAAASAGSPEDGPWLAFLGYRLHPVDLHGARARRTRHRPAAVDAEPQGADAVRRALVSGALCGAAIGADRRTLLGGLVARRRRRGDRDARRRGGARDGWRPLSARTAPPRCIEDAVAPARRRLARRGRSLMSRRFDAIVIGAGQAGPPLAGRLTAPGMTVALIERKLFGGTCVNTGCMPTKTLVASAYAAHLARRAADFGVVHRRPWAST